MLIINADDWGRTVAETDAALACQRLGRVTSVSAMVFMDDSVRAAELARAHGVDVGLHLNLSQHYSRPPNTFAAEAQAEIVRFMTKSKYALLFYQPALRGYFRDVYQAQADEFTRLYGKPPSHVDGHQHRHLCMNMLFDGVIPTGEKVRRNFSFWPAEKSFMNRAYRGLLDRWLGQRYCLVDFFFSLRECLDLHKIKRVVELADASKVELMAHPVTHREYAYLMSGEFLTDVRGLRMGSYAKE